MLTLHITPDVIHKMFTIATTEPYELIPTMHTLSKNTSLVIFIICGIIFIAIGLFVKLRHTKYMLFGLGFLFCVISVVLLSISQNLSSDETPSLKTLQKNAKVMPHIPIIDTVTPGDKSNMIVFHSNPGTNAVSYIAKSIPGNITATLKSSGDGIKVINVKNLINGTEYKFVIEATNKDGDTVTSLESKPVIPLSIPFVPVIKNITQNTSGVIVSFESDKGTTATQYIIKTSPDNTSYTLNVTGDGIKTITCKGLSLKEHVFTVIAVNTSGMSLSSKPVTFLVK